MRTAPEPEVEESRRLMRTGAGAAGVQASEECGHWRRMAERAVAGIVNGLI
jgi:hypothetical protein